MAVTVNQLRLELRATDDAEITAILTRVLGTAAALAENYAPDAPDAIMDEAVIRLAGWLFDTPDGGAPMLHSGAAALLNPWRVRRAGKVTA